jgi:hypothetical protein
MFSKIFQSIKTSVYCLFYGQEPTIENKLNVAYETLKKELILSYKYMSEPERDRCIEVLRNLETCIKELFASYQQQGSIGACLRLEIALSNAENFVKEFKQLRDAEKALKGK